MVTFRALNQRRPVLHMRLIFADGLFWVSVACCAVAQLLIVRSVRGRDYVPSTSANVPRARYAVEVLWAVLPAIALALVLWFTWRVIHPAPTEPDAPGAQRVSVLT